MIRKVREERYKQFGAMSLNLSTLVDQLAGERTLRMDPAAHQ